MQVFKRTYSTTKKVPPFIPKPTAEFWDRISAGFTESLFGALCQKFMPNIFDRIQLDECRAVKLLDNGAGSGTFSLIAKKKFGEKIQCHATDFSPKMVEVMKRRTEKYNIRIDEIRQEDAQNLGYPDDTFDYIVSNMTLMFLENPLKGLQEMRRTVKPGGRVIATVWNSIHENSQIKIAYKASGINADAKISCYLHAPQAIEKIIPCEKSVVTDLDNPNFKFSNPSLLQEVASQAKFSDVKITTITFNEIINEESKKQYIDLCAKGFAALVKNEMDRFRQELSANFDEITKNQDTTTISAHLLEAVK